MLIESTIRHSDDGLSITSLKRTWNLHQFQVCTLKTRRKKLQCLHVPVHGSEFIQLFIRIRKDPPNARWVTNANPIQIFRKISGRKKIERQFEVSMVHKKLPFAPPKKKTPRRGRSQLIWEEPQSHCDNFRWWCAKKWGCVHHITFIKKRLLTKRFDGDHVGRVRKVDKTGLLFGFFKFSAKLNSTEKIELVHCLKQESSNIESKIRHFRKNLIEDFEAVVFAKDDLKHQVMSILKALSHFLPN